MQRLTMVALIVALGALAAAGCVSKTQYGDAQAVETVNPDYGSTDLQMIAEKMVNSLLVTPIITQAPDRPVLIMKGVENRTSEHIDTRTITDKIRTQLLKSGMVRFAVMGEENQAAVEQLKYQQSGLVDTSTARSIGKQVGAEYLLIGNIKSIVKTAGGTKDVYYQFTLNLLNIENGLIEWADEKEIRKTRERSFLGL